MTDFSPLRIGISGSYGGNNLGDEAILQSIITQIRNVVEAEIMVFTRDPDDTLSRHKVDKAIPVQQIGRKESQAEIEHLDLFILGGGGILYDGDARTYLREVYLANDRGIPVMVYAVGAGPLKDPAVQAQVRECLEPAAVVTVRDRPSLRVLEEAGVHRQIIVTADPAILLKPEPLAIDFRQKEGIREDRKLVGLSVREPGKAAPDIKEKHYHALIANAADYMVDRYGANVVFIPMERKTTYDLHQSHAVITRMVYPQYASVLQGEYSPGQIMSILSNFDFVLGMRLHFLVFAALQGVPFIALPYAGKVLGFLEDLHIETPPFHDITPGRLIAHIDKAWDRREQILEHIRNHLPELQQRSLQNNTLLVELLRIIYARNGKSPDKLPKAQFTPGAI